MCKRGGSRRPRLDPPADPPPRCLQDTLFFDLFFDAFLNRFLIDLGSMFLPNLPPKNNKNQTEIYAKRHRCFIDLSLNLAPPQCIKAPCS